MVSQGHSVIQAAGGRHALALLDGGGMVDLVLTDLRMADMSSWDVVMVLRARRPELPVGVMTATPEASHTRSEPVEFMITKPATLEDLQGAISQIRPGRAPRC